MLNKVNIQSIPAQMVNTRANGFNNNADGTKRASIGRASKKKRQPSQLGSKSSVPILKCKCIRT